MKMKIKSTASNKTEISFIPVFKGRAGQKKIASCKGCGGKITFAISVALS
ncbi:MAG: hypothetical protein HRT95_02520 [Moritella sp.]|nr:hypothetical protein [Moritella sp.]NQZ49082.1 hypothetical protein [Moritella sp.]